MVLEVTARVVAAAFHVLGLKSRQDKPKNFPIPEDLASQSRLHQLQFLHKAAAKIVDEVVIDFVSMQERQEILNRLQLNEHGRFPCRFPGCQTSFKYNGKSRRRHELSHDPPVVITEEVLEATSQSTTATSKDADTCSITMLHSCLRVCSF